MEKKIDTKKKKSAIVSKKDSGKSTTKSVKKSISPKVIKKTKGDLKKKAVTVKSLKLEKKPVKKIKDIGVFYFSGTGNSLHISRKIADGTSAELNAVKNFISNDAIDIEYSKLVIVFPVYMWGPPLIIRDFIEKLSIMPGTKIYLVATYGAMLGRALDVTKKIFEGKDLKVTGAYGIRMPGNYTPLYDVYKEDEQNKLFEDSKVKIEEIIKDINSGLEHGVDKNMGIIGSIFSFIIRKGPEKKMKELDKKFYTDSKCTKCGVCVKVCPVKNIQLNGGKVEWLHKCEQCFACLHWCPEKSIQYGRKTSQRGRYHHPEIKLTDII